MLALPDQQRPGSVRNGGPAMDSDPRQDSPFDTDYSQPNQGLPGQAYPDNHQADI